MPLDLSRLKSVKEFADAFKKDYSVLHYLFLNAGIHKPKLFKELTSDDIELHLQINFVSNAFLILLLLDLLKKTESTIGIVRAVLNNLV